MRRVQRLRRVLGAVSLTLLLLGLAIAFSRVYALERSELSHEGTPRTLDQLAHAPGSTPSSARLASVELRAGEHALFELCARDPLTAAHFEGAFDLAVLRWPKPELMLRVPLDAAHLERARRSSSHACVVLGGGAIPSSGKHTLEAVWPERAPSAAVRSVPFYARVLAYQPIGALERGAIVLLIAGVALLLGWLFSAPASAARDLHTDDRNTDASEPRRKPHAQLAGWLSLAALGAIALATFLPLYGSTLGLLKGVLLLALHVAGALILARVIGPRREALALGRPHRLLAWLAVAVASSFLLSVAAKWALRIVPSTSEAPIESFVRFPSGMLAFAAIGVLVPVGEELFFRGFLYRAALPLGTAAACALSLSAFVSLHVAQSFGNWGGLLAIALTGAVLTTLRAASGTVLVPCVAHVLYNATLSLGSLGL
jgi:membrane protease YdiL (CAAX protease family)